LISGALVLLIQVLFVNLFEVRLPAGMFGAMF